MSDLQLQLEPPVARIVFNRPERRNAVSQAMWVALARVCAQIEAAQEVKAVIVEGAGGNFCSGADISEFDHVFADPDSARDYLANIEQALDALACLDRPTVAKIEGSCMGGGLAVALACDIRMAGENAQLSIPPAKLGLLYGVAETRLLLEAVGPAVAKDLLFSGRRLEAREAAGLALLNRVMPESDLASAVLDQVLLWSSLSGASIRGAKKAIRASLAGRDMEVRGLVETISMGPDFREGRSAFKAKRAPNFSGSA